jgi:hypothetical protein
MKKVLQLIIPLAFASTGASVLADTAQDCISGYQAAKEVFDTSAADGVMNCL